jgi:3'-phosphoadenosine 5'-phosphosulfate sulfotransferase (PAPS reductase)/FAD synthetase
MSIQYTFFNRTISKQEVLDNTPFKIENHNGSDWIISNNESNLRIKESILQNKVTGETFTDYDNIHELENHGFKDVHVIMDELISKFNLLFYTDDEWHQYIMEGETDIEPLVRNAMKRYGDYEIIDFDKGIVKIPKR